MCIQIWFWVYIIERMYEYVYSNSIILRCQMASRSRVFNAILYLAVTCHRRPVSRLMLFIYVYIYNYIFFSTATSTETLLDRSHTLSQRSLRYTDKSTTEGHNSLWVQDGNIISETRGFRSCLFWKGQKTSCKNINIRTMAKMAKNIQSKIILF